MKWGKRQGPPYPLNPADHSAAEKKASGQKSGGSGSTSSSSKKDSPNKEGIPSIQSKEGDWYDGYGGSKYKVNKHSVSNKGKNNAEFEKKYGFDFDKVKEEYGLEGKELERLKEDIQRGYWADYDKAIDDFDLEAMRAVDIFTEKGKEAAFKYVHEKLKDFDYEFSISEEYEKYVDNGKEYVEQYGPIWHLTVGGKEWTYNSAGDNDYSDDQYFDKKR